LIISYLCKDNENNKGEYLDFKILIMLDEMFLSIGTIKEDKYYAFASAFINKHNLSATSSIKSALKALLNNEIVYRSDDGYMIYDRFFGDWLTNFL